MLKHADITRRRLRSFSSDDNLAGRLCLKRAPVRLSVYSPPGRITWIEAMRGRYRPAQVGERFGPLWSTHWFKVRIAVPRDWKGEEVHFLWDSCSEACIWQGGTPVQGLTGTDSPAGMGGSKGIRTEFVLTKSARGGERMTLYVEAACNHLFGCRNPILREIIGLLKQAEIAAFDREAWDLLWDFSTIAEMAQHLPPNTPRAAQALYAGNRMVNLCDLDNRSAWPEGALSRPSLRRNPPGWAARW